MVEIICINFQDIAVKDPTFTQFSTVNQLFPANSEVFMLGSPHYGAMGKVLEVDSQKNDRIRIDFSILQEPDFSNIWHREKVQGFSQNVYSHPPTQCCQVWARGFWEIWKLNINW